MNPRKNEFQNLLMLLLPGKLWRLIYFQTKLPQKINFEI